MLRWLPLLMIACTPPVPGPEAVADPLPYASPLMGTGGFAYFHGSAFPGACVPHGLVKVGPDTRGAKYGDLRFIHYSGYWAGDDTAMGFSHLHLHGAGATDWGALILQPVTSSDPTVLNRDVYMSRFSKRGEVASPGSYEITLQKWSVKAELTASTHAAHHRYTFAENDAPHVVLDLSKALAPGRVTEQTLTQVDATTLRGSLLLSGQMSDGFGGNRLFFELRTNRAYTVRQTSADGHVVLLGFEPGAPVELMLGLSLVSASGATANLAAEMPAFDFDAHRTSAEEAWRAKLSRARVFGGSEADRATFYSALRLAFLMPTVISDVSGEYVFAGQRGVMPAGEPMLSDFSLWDTYRTVHPLYSLIDEGTARASVTSLLRMAEQGRGLPRWPMGTGESGTMVGAPSDIVIADAVLRDVPGLDAEAVWRQVSVEALGTPRGSRAQMGRYATLGFVPVEESSRSVGVTVEYSHADFALANLAKKLGHEQEADQLTVRAHGWRKLFDPATKVLRAHHADGTLVAEPYVLTSWDHYAEANALQTTFMPFWDPEAFDTLYGSRAAFLTELEAFFDVAPAEEAEALALPTFELRYLPRNHYWPSNEPDIQAPFMFARAGRPDLTAKWSDWARDTYFSAAPEGVPGNDDGGTLGSWFVFAAAGLYPVPGSATWIVGSPLFPKLELKLPGGTFTIEAQGVSVENLYVQSAKLNGAPLLKAELTQSDLIDGGKLVLVMGPSPSTWGH